MGRQPAYVGLSIAVSVLLVLGLAATLVFDGGSYRTRVIDDLIAVALSAYATVCAVLAARSAGGRMRRAWATLAAALAHSPSAVDRRAPARREGSGFITGQLIPVDGGLLVVGS